jgi:hypothetical protein
MPSAQDYIVKDIAKRPGSHPRPCLHAFCRRQARNAAGPAARLPGFIDASRRAAAIGPVEPDDTGDGPMPSAQDYIVKDIALAPIAAARRGGNQDIKMSLCERFEAARLASPPVLASSAVPVGPSAARAEAPASHWRREREA